MLHLEQQLDPLDGGDGRLGDGRGYSSGEEILDEGHGIGESRRHLAQGMLETWCVVCTERATDYEWFGSVAAAMMSTPRRSCALPGAWTGIGAATSRRVLQGVR